MNDATSLAQRNAVHKYYSKTISEQRSRSLLNYYIKQANKLNLSLQQFFEMKLNEYESHYNGILLLQQNLNDNIVN